MNAFSHSSPQPIVAESLADNRIWLWTRVVLAYGLLECALWTGGETQRIFSWMCLGWVIASTLFERRSLDELGLGLKGLNGASIALVITGAAFAIMVGLASAFGTLGAVHGARAVPAATGYIIWSFLQEFLLNSFFFLAFERLFHDSRKAVWAAVFLFVFAHLPNPVLMIATFLLSIVFVSIFRRYRNIYPLGLGHAILGLTIAITVPDVYLEHMRVGLGYLHLVFK